MADLRTEDDKKRQAELERANRSRVMNRAERAELATLRAKADYQGVALGDR